MANEYKKVDGLDVVVEVSTVKGPDGKEFKRAMAFTKDQLLEQKAGIVSQVATANARLDAMLELLK